MKITTITHERTYNTGNYTSQRFGMSADLDTDEDPIRALCYLADRLDQAAQMAMNPMFRPEPEPVEVAE